MKAPRWEVLQIVALALLLTAFLTATALLKLRSGEGPAGQENGVASLQTKNMR